MPTVVREGEGEEREGGLSSAYQSPTVGISPKVASCPLMTVLQHPRCQYSLVKIHVQNSSLYDHLQKEFLLLLGEVLRMLYVAGCLLAGVSSSWAGWRLWAVG